MCNVGGKCEAETRSTVYFKNMTWEKLISFSFVIQMVKESEICSQIGGA